MVRLLSCLCGASQLSEPSIQSSRTSYVSHARSPPHPTISVASIHQAASACAENSPCRAVQFWRLCPWPSQVRHLRTARQALSSSSSSSSSPSSSSAVLARSLRLSPIAFNISSNDVSVFVVVDRAFSTFLIRSCSCTIAVSASWNCFLATTDSLSTSSSMHFSLSSLLKKVFSRLFSTESSLLDCKLCNAHNARTLSGSKPHLPLFACWSRGVDIFGDLPYLPARSGKLFFFQRMDYHCVLCWPCRWAKC